MKKTLALICTLVSVTAVADTVADPAADDTPQLEFAFEERVLIDPAIVQGETPLGHRQYIPITGGTVTGPKLKGVVVPGGWDYQLTYKGSDCTQLYADYFLKSDEGVLIHVVNEGLVCPGAPRTIFRPKLEAPNGPYGWMSQSTFVATLEVEGKPPHVPAVRIRFYQVK